MIRWGLMTPMPHINLLPWRKTLTKEREIRFAIITGLSFALTGLVWLVVHLYMASEHHYQTNRNQYLEGELKKAEAQIKEIDQLDQQKQSLIERMNIIQALEQSRPKIVHLFDEIVKQVPNGVYFTSMTQKGNQITINGVAQSEARVSSLMKNIERSEWLTEPKIFFIGPPNQLSGHPGRHASPFKLEAKQTAPKKDKSS